jgi:hypothetical protein
MLHGILHQLQNFRDKTLWDTSHSAHVLDSHLKAATNVTIDKISITLYSQLVDLLE